MLLYNPLTGRWSLYHAVMPGTGLMTQPATSLFAAGWTIIANRVALPRSGDGSIYDHVEGRGRDLFRVACERDLEGVVGKWAHGTYQTDGCGTSWVKVKKSSVLADSRSA